MSEPLKPTSVPVKAPEISTAGAVEPGRANDQPRFRAYTGVSAYLPAEEETYQPISGWATAGLVLSLFSIFCWMDSPPLFSARAWWLPGLVVSAWAWRKIAQAPHTLAGDTLARLGVAFSLINGLGAITAQEVTYWVVRTEALRFAQEILDYVHLRKERELFLATLEPESRRYKEPPADRDRLIRYFESQSRMGNPVLGFESSPLGQVMLKYAPHRQNWEFRGITGYEVLTDVSRPGYRFRLLYRVRSDMEEKDGEPPVFDVELSLVCQRLSDTRSRWKTRREWFLENSPSSVRLASVP
ncbi:hypothetical protein HRbin36_01401 [bacterium HR36]|nr:hypothetical protein HRbin36_01401 [bacterium HR36]